MMRTAYEPEEGCAEAMTVAAAVAITVVLCFHVPLVGVPLLVVGLLFYWMTRK